MLVSPVLFGVLVGVLVVVVVLVSRAPAEMEVGVVVVVVVIVVLCPVGKGDFQARGAPQAIVVSLLSSFSFWASPLFFLQ